MNNKTYTEYKKMMYNLNTSLMDSVKLPNVDYPTKIYKYGHFDNNGYWKETIYNGLVFLQKPLKFNDPFDCNIRFDTKAWEMYFEEQAKKLYDTSNISDSQLKTIVSETLSQYFPTLQKIYKEETFVSCFSEIYDSILMWSHYSNKHRGFCIEYKTGDIPFLPVIYTDEIYDSTNCIVAKDKKAALNILFHKSDVWNYEKEWRIFYSKEIQFTGNNNYITKDNNDEKIIIKNNNYYYDLRKNMKAIYLGINSTPSLEFMNWASKHHIKIFKMQLHKKYYKLIPKRIY